MTAILHIFLYKIKNDVEKYQMSDIRLMKLVVILKFLLTNSKYILLNRQHIFINIKNESLA